MNSNDFYDYWDKVILNWRDNEQSPIHPTQAFWFRQGQRHIDLLDNQLPEPYWGRIDDNSVTFINFNPGGEHDQCKWENRKRIDTISGYLSKNYSEKAIPFGLLNDCFYLRKGKNGKDYEGTIWWRNRIKWLDQFGISSEDRQPMPFAIELCAWHSKKWKRANYDDEDLIKYISEYFGPWLKLALEHSKYHLVLCVGREFVEKVLPLVWGEELKNITSEIFDKSIMDMENNCMKLYDDNDRRFWFFEVPQGHIVCTSARGSNGKPSAKKFQNYEMKIYEHIKRHHTV